MRRSRQGFTLVEIMIVVAVIGVLAAIAVPTYSRAREKSATNACLNHLRQISDAKEEYAFEHYGTGPSVVSDLVPDYINKVPVCSAGGSYTVGALGEDPLCDAANHTL